MHDKMLITPETPPLALTNENEQRRQMKAPKVCTRTL